MVGNSVLVRSISAAAFITVATAPAALSAQTFPGERGSAQPSYHLVQLSIEKANVSAEDFKTRTEAIDSCASAVKLGRKMGAEITRNRFVTQRQMPESLQEILRDLPVGEATPVYSADGDTMRVLVICNRAN